MFKQHIMNAASSYRCHFKYNKKYSKQQKKLISLVYFIANILIVKAPKIRIHSIFKRIERVGRWSGGTGLFVTCHR